MNQQKIGNLIKIRRQELGLTQNELAKMINVSDKAVSKWESGNGMPDISNLKALSNALNIKIEDLLEGNNITTTEKVDIIEKRLNEKTKGQIITEKIVKTLIISILIFMFIFLFVSILNGFVRQYKPTNILYYDGDVMDLKEADKNLEIIKNSTSSIYSKEDKEAIINYLTAIKTSIYDARSKISEEELNKKHNLYKTINLNFDQIDRLKLYYENTDFSHLSLYNTLKKYNENIIDNSNNYKTKTINISDFIYANQYDKFYLVLHANDILFSVNNLINEIKHLLENDWTSQSNVYHIYGNKRSLNDFYLEKYYLESTKIVIEVGDLHE